MSKRCVHLVVALIAWLIGAQPLYGQPGRRDSARVEPVRAASGDAARVAGWRADVDSLTAQLQTRHWRYRDVPLPKEFVDGARRLRSGIDTLDDEQVVVALQALLATLHDGHTLLYPFGMQRGGLSHLPIALYEFDDGLAVIAADSANARLVGRRVQRIDGVRVPDLVTRLTPIASMENPSQLRWVYPTYLTFPAFLRAAGVTTNASGVRLEIDSGSRTTEVLVRAASPPIDPGSLVLGLVPPREVAGARAPMYLSRLGDAYWFTRLDDGGAVYLQVNRVVNDQAEPLEKFSSRLLDSLMRPSTKALIVDLRNNSGGNGAVLPPLIRSLAAYRALQPTARIYLLIGRQTFSAAQTLVNRIEEYCAPIIVGEESGSKPNRFGNGLSFRLPYSGVRGEISGGYNQAATSRDTRMATAPQIKVGLTLRDWLAGRDPALDSIRVLIR
ncbi:MAG TPA: hypothetical protein VJT85_09280 [Gemmatimonadaceae bacterium]|nr:hypothetical protein [Gemmatimonadaceae bacterium]